MDTSGKGGRLRISMNAPVVLGFVFACVAVQVLSSLTGGASTQVFFTCYRGRLSDPLSYVRLVSFAFGHASWDHLIGNMSYILLLGPLLEEKYGSRTLAKIMLASALACGLANVALFPARGIVGASGVVFTMILLSSVTSVRQGEIPLTFILVAGLYLGQQVMAAFFVGGQISYLSHIIGGIVGAAFGFMQSGDA